MKKTKKIVVRATEKEHEELKKLSEVTGKTMSCLLLEKSPRDVRYDKKVRNALVIVMDARDSMYSVIDRKYHNQNSQMAFTIIKDEEQMSKALINMERGIELLWQSLL